jgi:hypothetical protein
MNRAARPDSFIPHKSSKPPLPAAGKIRTIASSASDPLHPLHFESFSFGQGLQLAFMDCGAECPFSPERGTPSQLHLVLRALQVTHTVAAKSGHGTR